MHLTPNFFCNTALTTLELAISDDQSSNAMVTVFLSAKAGVPNQVAKTARQSRRTIGFRNHIFFTTNLLFLSRSL
jgi:hypothetical protein